MKNLLLSLIAFSILLSANAQIDQNFYFGKTVATIKNIPEPGDICGQTFGDWHFSHDQLVQYFKAVAEKSDRMKLVKTGKTYEGRPLMLAFISSPENIQNLESIRKEHLDFIESNSNKPVTDQLAVVWLGYGVHGNESSASNSSMLSAYYLTSSDDEDVLKLLDQTIIIIDPSLNPDGFNRAASWVNMNQSERWIGDPNNTQFAENWPGGRTNHYWFDLNRDWLLVQHLESKARVKNYHEWKPTVLTDHHEMGSNGTFFFQPGVLSRNNPLTPMKNYDLTKLIGTYHAEAFDSRNALYYSEESFDDFYYGKGSSYPDANGSIAILFEQARVNGQIMNNTHGTTTFADAIRNQFTVSMSTLKATFENKEQFLNYQKEFVTDAIQLSKNDPIKAYAFADQDKVKLSFFLDLLNLHQIELYKNSKSIKINGINYAAGDAFIVPLAQSQYRLAKSLFEKRTTYKDSIFYDVSTWTMPLAFNINYTDLKKYEEFKGEKVNGNLFPESKLIGEDTKIGYVFKWNNYLAPKLLNTLLEKDVFVKAATKPYETVIDNKQISFSYGSIFIPLTNQKYNKEELTKLIQDLASQNGIDLFAIQKGTNTGIDMGSSSLEPLTAAKTIMLIGNGLDSRNAGEIWHLLDYKYHFPLVRLDLSRFERLNLFDYNTLILPNGRYDFSADEIEKLQFWVKQGGSILAFGSANQYLSEKKIINLTVRKNTNDDSNQRMPYADSRYNRQGNSLSGVIMNADIDNTHPVFYGYESTKLPMYKSSSFVVEQSKNAYGTPAFLPQNSLLSGYLNAKNKTQIENSAYILSSRVGNGRVISFIDNPNYRAYWLGTNKTVLNAIVFRELIR